MILTQFLLRIGFNYVHLILFCILCQSKALRNEILEILTKLTLISINENGISDSNVVISPEYSMIGGLGVDPRDLGVLVGHDNNDDGLLAENDLDALKMEWNIKQRSIATNIIETVLKDVNTYSPEQFSFRASEAIHSIFPDFLDNFSHTLLSKTCTVNRCETLLQYLHHQRSLGTERRKSNVMTNAGIPRYRR